MNTIEENDSAHEENSTDDDETSSSSFRRTNSFPVPHVALDKNLIPGQRRSSAGTSLNPHQWLRSAQYRKPRHNKGDYIWGIRSLILIYKLHHIYIGFVDVDTY